VKRDEHLYPLSWQHHNGLMAVLLLKKGINKGVVAKVMSDFILFVWNNELKEHFHAEEKALTANKDDAAHRRLYMQMKEEHQQIIAVIEQIKNEDCGIADVDLFQQLLEKHIRFEERVFFPWLEQHSANNEMRKIGEQLQHLQHHSCVNYPVKFWE
jgi:hemerythrin-like domain-containing protein